MPKWWTDWQSTAVNYAAIKADTVFDSVAIIPCAESTPPKTLLQCELELALWLCICEGSQGWSWHAGSHTADKALSGCGADCRLSSYRKGRRNLAHEDEEGEGDVSDQPPSTGPTFLSLQSQHCTLNPVSSPTVPGITSSIPCFRGHKPDAQFISYTLGYQ